jgi:hypothetical protein
VSPVPNPSRRQGVTSQGRRSLSMGSKDPRGSHRAPQGMGDPALVVAEPLVVRDGVITIDMDKLIARLRAAGALET